MPGVLARMFVPENLDGDENYVRAYARHVEESMMRVLYSELKNYWKGWNRLEVE